MRKTSQLGQPALTKSWIAITAVSFLASACGSHITANSTVPGSDTGKGTGTGTDTGKSDAFQIPSGAFKNKLGNFPARNFSEPNFFGTPSDPCSAFARNTPYAQPGLGTPLGGVGAGSFMINQAGSFGPWDFGGVTQQDENGCVGQYENRILPQAAFHIREQANDGSATVKTLAVRAAPYTQLLSKWNTLKVGDGDYAALWPFGWTSYKTLKTNVAMRFWSPIVTENDEYTSMPVAYFDVVISNPTSDTINTSVMLTMPNAPEHTTGATVRKGLSSIAQSDKKTGVSAVTLSASSPDNTTDAKDTDWTIAAQPKTGQTVSYVTSWNGAGDGSDIYQAFGVSGDLPNGAIDNSSSAGAIAVSVSLAPGASTTMRFALAWDFPRVTSPQPSWGTADQFWMRRYTSFFGAKETARNDYVVGSYPAHQGFNIANKMLAEHDQALTLVEGWWNRIARSGDYPDWMVRLALNEMIHMVFNDAFWASSLITDTPSALTRIGAEVPGTHLFCTTSGGNWSPPCNEWDTDAPGYLAEMLLWPNLERDRLRAVVQETNALRHDGIGDTGVTRQPTFGVQPIIEQYTGRLQFLDVPSKSIFRMYAYYRRTGDKEFLKYAYPAMYKLLETLRAGARPPNYLPLAPPGQTSNYDAWLTEVHTIYTSELYLLSLEVMIHATDVARELGVAEATPEYLQTLQGLLPMAKQQFELEFWNPVLEYYNLDALHGALYGVPSIFMDSLYAEHMASTLGLPGLVDPVRKVKHMNVAYPRQMSVMVNGHLMGPPNLVPYIGPLETTARTIEEGEVWIGPAIQYAAEFIETGRAQKIPEFINMGLEMAHAMEYQLIDNIPNGYLFAEPDAYWFNDPTNFRAPSFSRTRSGPDLLNTWKHYVEWKVPPPSPSLYTGTPLIALPQ